MSKGMRKNSFVEGTFVAYIAILISKIMGALYSIPFYQMIGEQGGVIYSCAYSVYALFLDISTAGIPIAVSIVISEYNAKKMYRSKERAYRMCLLIVTGMSLLSFLALQIFAKQVGVYFLGDMTEGVSVADIAAGVRVVSVCLLIAPLLSIKRGYLQGHKFIAASSQSQVIEQFVRIAVVLAGTYVAIYVLKLGTTVGVCVALSGAAAGALAAYLYLRKKSRESEEVFRLDDTAEEHPASGREVLRKVASYCITLVIMSVSINVYHIVDMKMLLVGLHKLKFSDADTQVIASIASTWVPKIGMIITALSTGLSSSIAPHMAASRSAGNKKELARNLNQALGTILLISVPLGLGMIYFAEPIFLLFYGKNAYGPELLRLAVVVNVVGNMATVASMTMQSVGRGKTVCIVNLIGIVLNAGLDLPLIYLFNALGLPPYLGASVASVIGQGLTAFLLLRSLKRAYGFRLRKLWQVLLRELIPMGAMMASVVLLRALWAPVAVRGFLLVVQLALYAAVGGGVYLVLAYRFGAVSAVIGNKALRRLMNRLPFRKANG